MKLVFALVESHCVVFLFAVVHQGYLSPLLESPAGMNKRGFVVF